MSLRNLIASTALLVFASNVNAASLNFVDSASGDFRLASINDLDIGGSSYDVTFNHGVSFSDLGSDAISFNGQRSAAVADKAIRDFVNSMRVDASSASNRGLTNLYLIPHTEYFGAISFSESSYARSKSPLRYRDGMDYLFAFNDWTLGSNVAWVTFSEAAPEEPLDPLPFAENPVPGSFIMLAMTALTVGGIRFVGHRRRARG